LNRVVWDLKADAKHGFATSPNDVPGPEQFVSAGKYKVTIQRGEEKDERTVEVLPFPGLSR
jgi:hypothetical protein